MKQMKKMYWIVVFLIILIVFVIPYKTKTVVKKEIIKKTESKKTEIKETTWSVKWYHYDPETG